MVWSYSKLASSQLNLITGCELYFDLLVFFTSSIFNWTHHHKGQELFHFLCQAGFPVGCAEDTPARWVSGLPGRGILLSTETKGAQESGVGGFLSPNMWPDLKIQLPGFFCLLVSMSAPVCPGNVWQDSPLLSRRPVGGTGAGLPLPKSADWNPLCLEACCVY